MVKRIFRGGFIVLLLLALNLTVFVAGCGRQEEQNNNNGGEDNGSAGGGYYEIKGSDSEVNLVQALVESFAGVNQAIEFSVTGGGSGAGIAALINRQTDIANSSRPMKDSEIAEARANGVEPVPIVFSMDGLAVIVHQDNPLKQLTVSQIGRIFAGEITNWNEIGGEDREISLYGRQSNSGTYVFFRDRVVKGDYSTAMHNMNGNSQIVEGVRADISGIGYVALGFLQGATGIRALEVAETEAGPFISPVELERVKAGEYVLTRPLYQYFNGSPNGALKEFVDFTLSAQGQEIVESQGFLPVSEVYMNQNKQYLR